MPARSLRNSVVLVALLALASSATAQQAPTPPDDETFWEVIQQVRWIELGSGPDLSDPRVHAAWNLRQVQLGRMSPPEFYRALSTMDLGGVQPRQFLIDLKTDLLARLGTGPAAHILGEVYYKDSSRPTGTEHGQTSARGSKVEDILLDWRSRLAEEVKTRAARSLPEQKFSA